MEETEIEKPPVYPLAIPWRFLLAFLIGVPTTMIFPFVSIPTPVWWQLGTPLTILLLALLLGIARDRVVLEARIEPKQIRNGMITAVLIIVAYFVFEVLMWNLGKFAGFTSLIALPVVPLMVGITAAFVGAGGKTKGFGVFCGIFGWLGAATANMILTYFDAKTLANTAEMIKLYPKNSESTVIGAALAVSVMLHLSGLAISAYGGDLGWKLRRRLLGPLSVRDTSGQIFVKKE